MLDASTQYFRLSRSSFGVKYDGVPFWRISDVLVDALNCVFLGLIYSFLGRMARLPSSSEITESIEGPASKMNEDAQLHHHMKRMKKYCIEDDINKLFEAIEIRNIDRGVNKSKRGVKDVMSKSAMKRPMRSCPSRASGIGISEPVNLKQALRGLCISQASELAAVKKQSTKAFRLSAVSETGALKRTYSAIVEANDPDHHVDGGVGNLVEIFLVPERSMSDSSHKSPESANVPAQEQSTFVTHTSNLSEDVMKHKASKILAERSILTKADERSGSKEKGQMSQSSKSSIGDYSNTTSLSDESYLNGSSRSGYRPRMSKDLRWKAIFCVQKQHGNIGLRHFKLLRKLGGGDIGNVYLSEITGTNCLFAVKVMDNELLTSKRKITRAQTEKEILQILDHPFLPTLYAHFINDKYSCLVMEYCPGGDLHVLRQKQPSKSFSEQASRFYVAEVLLALEYLHLLGVVYRDLKPENVLVREDGHIMLSDFDLSLRCAVNPTLLTSSSSPVIEPPKKSSPCSVSSCIDPFCLNPSWQVSCFSPRFSSAAAKTHKLKADLPAQVSPLPQLVVEPTNARSNSFVGTHEYLAPEIIKGEGHGSAVDWWTFGIFLYELLYGRTPFKGLANEDTLANVVSQCLKFPESPTVSSRARDLIRRLLQKEPDNRLGAVRGAAEIKQHPFFEGLNWALIRCSTPPEMPRFYDLANVFPDANQQHKESSKCQNELKSIGEINIEFEIF